MIAKVCICVECEALFQVLADSALGREGEGRERGDEISGWMDNGREK